MLWLLAQTSRPAPTGMRTWTPEEWGIFFTVAGVFVGVVCTAIGALAVKIILAQAELRRAAATNAKALMPLIEANDRNPDVPNVDPAVRCAVNKTANPEQV